MNNISNEDIVKLMFKDFGEKNLAGVASAFNKDVVWIRAGAPDIPFSGTFNGMEGMTKMLTLIQETIELKHFTPIKFCTNKDTVIVLGHDEAVVRATGKTYQTDWVQAYTFKDTKIILAQVYMDTLTIAKAFQP